MLEIKSVHHVSVPVRDLKRAKYFYETVLGLKEKETEKRPDFPFGGAWYQVGDRMPGDECHQELHLIVDEECRSTFREGKEIDSRDIHLALRVADYEETRKYLSEQHGYDPATADEFKRMKLSPDNLTPWQQIYIMDPDRNVIELNAPKPTAST